MDLNLREISYFLKIVDFGSLSGAAQALSMNQPTLSRALKRLEDKLGSELFTRHTLGMDLTAFGAAFLAHAQILQADANRTVEDLSMLTGSSKGAARVGIVPSIANYLMPPVVESIFRETRDMRIQILEASSIRLVSELEMGNIDFAISSSLHAQDNPSISSTDLIQEPLRVICRADHPILTGTPRHVGELLDYPWIIPEKGNAILLDLQKMFHQAGMEPPIGNISANSGNTLKATVARSDFLTMLPALATLGEEKQGLLCSVPLTVAPPKRQLSIVRRAARPLLPAANLVLARIRRVAAGLAQEVEGVVTPGPRTRG